MNTSYMIYLCSKSSQQQLWACPNCRGDYASGDLPQKYTCFCGKLGDPPFDPWLAPHSCGQTCERTLTGCGHSCTLLCHPLKCPPCPSMIVARCFSQQKIFPLAPSKVVPHLASLPCLISKLYFTSEDNLSVLAMSIANRSLTFKACRAPWYKTIAYQSKAIGKHRAVT